MVRGAIILLCSACSLAPLGQGIPRWVDSQSREAEYPPHTYITGFAADNLSPGETLAQATARLNKAALGGLAESIRVKISTRAHSEIESIVRTNGYSETDRFWQEITTSAQAEMVGVHTETYFDKAKKTLYAFAYANRRELTGYYSATADSDMQQIKSMVQIAAQCEAQGKKIKAHKHYNDAKNLLAQTGKTLTLWMALDASASGNAPPLSTWVALREKVTQALAHLDVLVYVNAREDLFGKPCAIVTNTLKAGLTKDGYRLTDDASRADLTINLHATMRKIGDPAGAIVFCYADVVVELLDNSARESVYKEELSCKGGATTFERAGREALGEAAAVLAEKLSKIIE